MQLITDYLDIIALAASVVAILLTVVIAFNQSRVVKAQKEKSDELNIKLNKTQQTIKSHDDKLHEVQTALYGMSGKLKNLQNVELPESVSPEAFQALQGEVSLLVSKIRAIESADPGSKLYTKAAKLVASGATIEDVMQECELPRAEAELLMSLHAQKN